MATQEFYIRNESETEARGPFNQEQLSSLADTGQLTDETLVYNEASEDWIVIGTNLELTALLFPEKKKLQIRAQVEEETADRAKTDSRPPITVDEMLAAAEGRTADTKDRLDPQIAMGRAAAIGAWSVFIMLILSSAAEIAPSIDFVTKFQVEKLLEHPPRYFRCTRSSLSGDCRTGYALGLPGDSLSCCARSGFSRLHLLYSRAFHAVSRSCRRISWSLCVHRHGKHSNRPHFITRRYRRHVGCRLPYDPRR